MHVVLYPPLVHRKVIGSPSFYYVSWLGDDGFWRSDASRSSPLYFRDSLALKSRADESPSQVRRSLVLDVVSESLNR